MTMPRPSAEPSIEETSAQRAEQGVRAAGSGAPMATEPLDPVKVNALAEIATEAAAELTGGQVPLPEVPKATEPLEQVPLELFALINGHAQLAATFPAASEYAFDPVEAVSSDEGLANAIATIGAMARDKKVLRAAANGQPEAPSVEEAPAEEPAAPDPERLIK